MTRDRIKMLGLVLLCASLTLAILLPAIGIQKVERDGILLNNTREVGIRVRNLPVWVVMTGSGLAGFALWIAADFLRSDAARPQRKR